MENRKARIKTVLLVILTWLIAIAIGVCRIGAIFMSLSTIIVAINAQLLKRQINLHKKIISE